MYKKKSLLFVLLFITLTSFQIHIKDWIYKGEEVLLYVDDEPIVHSEFEFFKQKVRTDVISYYKEKYNLRDFKDFWKRTYGKEKPEETLKKFALDATIEHKIQYIILKEKGIVDTIDFNSFNESLEKENIRREKILENGGIIYGPKKYSKQVYYSYLLSNAILDLKNKVVKEVADYDLLRSKYDKIKHTAFKAKPAITVGVLSVHYDNSKINNKEEALIEIKKIKKELELSPDFEKTLNSLATINGVQVLGKYELKSELSRSDGEKFGQLYSHMEKLHKGEISNILDIDQKLSILVCYDKIKKGCISFEEVEAQLENLVFDDWFNDLLSKRKKVAKIIRKEGF